MNYTAIFLSLAMGSIVFCGVSKGPTLWSSSDKNAPAISFQTYDQSIAMAKSALADNKLDEAAQLYDEALKEAENTYGELDARVVTAACYGATLAADSCNFKKAEALYRKALAIQKKIEPENAEEISATRSALHEVLRQDSDDTYSLVAAR